MGKLLIQQKEELLKRGHHTFAEMREKENDCTDPIDMAADHAHQTCTLQIKDREHQQLKKVLDALERIQSGEYGYCETCGEDISVARLRAQPFARHCLECKIKLENQEKTTYYNDSFAGR